MKKRSLLRIIRNSLAALLVLAMLAGILLLSACHTQKKPGGPSGATPEADLIGDWEYTRDASLPDYATMVKLNTSDINADFEYIHQYYVEKNPTARCPKQFSTDCIRI